MLSAFGCLLKAKWKRNNFQLCRDPWLPSAIKRDA